MKPLTQFPTFLLILLAGSFELLAGGITVLKNAEGTTSVEVEPNNNSENANPIYSGVTVSGNFVNGDLDMYSFSLSNPSMLTFSSDELYGDVTISAPDSSVIFKEQTLYRDTFQIAGVQTGTYLIDINRDSYSPDQYNFKLTFDQVASPDQIQTLKEGLSLASGISVLKNAEGTLSVEVEPNNNR
jgi:copper chaperone CopZ